jgi:hypothetical protein
MKIVRVTKKMLNMHPADLLVSLGAVDGEKRTAFPQHVYFSKEDYTSLCQNLKNKFKKEIPGIRGKVLSYSVGMELLNYGPNESYRDAIRPGFALVDFESISQQKKSD